MRQTFATTKMSSRGQVVIPETVRRQLGLDAGVKFVVVGHDDVVMLKVIHPSSVDDYEELMGRLRKDAKAAGRTPAEIQPAIERARKR